ncbi:MAG: BatD family protein [Gammaproteobacteria bacterium]
MRHINTVYLYVICLLASFMATQVHAFGFSTGNSKPFKKETGITTNRPWGNIAATKPAPQYQPPPPPSNAYYPGAAPDTGWYTQQQPGYNTTAAGQPVVEVDVEGSIFYENQNIVYTVRVVSAGNLKSLNPELPRIEGAVLEQIDGPVASTRKDGISKQRQIVNTFRYKLLPLRAGKVIIPAMRFNGTHADDRQSRRGPGMPATAPAGRFNIAASRDLTLRVRAADAAVNPWLPLHDLKLHVNLLQTGPVKAGEPVTLELELAAKGAQGNQLPSLAAQLESPHYRIYRDSTNITNGISARGNYLTGSRKETYTLIPLEDGWVRLPEVTVAWWDVDTDTAERVELPFAAAASADSKGLATAATGSKYSLSQMLFWAPLVIVFSLIAGYWLGSWHRTRPLMSSAATRLSLLGQHVVRHASRVSARLSPAAHLKRLRMSFAMLMPRTVRLWMCARCQSAGDNPEAWCMEFRTRVCGQLNISENAPLSYVAEKIIEASPQAEPAKLRTLTQSLDRAIYGSSALDFPAWKREFAQQLRPRVYWRRHSRRRYAKATLPALNPRAM